MGLFTRLVSRMDRIADRDADPEALTGRSGSRRHGLPVQVEKQVQAEPSRRSDPPELSTARKASTDQSEDPQAALDRIRADQHRRMRRGSFGRQQADS